ncbi:MAG: GDP-mannose 4,6-dehydratase [bacterium]
MSRVLVTGIEGFVGGHLARRLRDSGHDVVGIHYAEPPAGLPARLMHGDVRVFPLLRLLVRASEPDWVVHLAGLSSVATSETRGSETWTINATGTLNLLESVRQLELDCRVLVISSADVYGRSNIGKPLEEDAPELPLSPYALSKQAAEDIARFYHRAYGTQCIILRPFSHTGPGQAPNFVFPKVAHAIAQVEAGRRDPVIEMGNLEVRRDYTDVRDIVRAYELALQHCTPGETYNVTSGKPALIGDGVELLRSKAKVPVEVRTAAAMLRGRDIPVLTGNPDKFRAATGWMPEIPFDQTLSDLLDYYRAQAE